jgi:hypothetical protein
MITPVTFLAQEIQVEVLASVTRKLLAMKGGGYYSPLTISLSSILN